VIRERLGFVDDCLGAGAIDREGYFVPSSIDGGSCWDGDSREVRPRCCVIGNGGHGRGYQYGDCHVLDSCHCCSRGLSTQTISDKVLVSALPQDGIVLVAVLR